MSARAEKVSSIQEAAARGWRPDGRPRKAAPPPRVSPEILLRSPLFLVERSEREQSVRQAQHFAASAAEKLAFGRVMTASSTYTRAMPLTIGPEARLHQSLWRRQDKYYAVILLGFALLVWWNPF